MNFKEIKKNYIFVVDSAAYKKRAEEEGFTDVISLDELSLSKTEMEEIAQTKKPVVFIFYGECDELNFLTDLIDRGVNVICSSLQDGYVLNCDMFERYKTYETYEESLRWFISVEDVERGLEDRGLLLETDYTGRCGNCHSYMAPEDKYCRYCGTEKGKGKFEPYLNRVYCVYGPPITTKYKCSNCNHSWIVSTLGSDKTEYCPMCGKRISACFD